MNKRGLLVLSVFAGSDFYRARGMFTFARQNLDETNGDEDVMTTWPLFVGHAEIDYDRLSSS